MAENDKQGPAPEQGNPQAGGFPLTVVSQYVKDLSFENPGGPDSLLTLKEVPHGTVRVDVRVQPRTPPEIEIVPFLAVEAPPSHSWPSARPMVRSVPGPEYFSA